MEIFLVACVCVCVFDHSSSNHSLMHGHLDCLHYFAITNCAVMKDPVHTCFCNVEVSSGFTMS